MSYYSIISKKNKLGINKIEKRDTKIIVSLTTYPARIDLVWQAIESLLRQTFKPDKIILWLAESQFNGINSLPEKLIAQQSRGLSIRFCDDLGPHKKYYNTMKEFPEDIVVTVDDDCFYPENMLEALMNIHRKYPECICCNRGRLVKKNEDNTIAPYQEWPIQMGFIEPTKLLCPTGVGGVLYPPKSMSIEVFDKESIKNICLFTDDLWLKVMSLRKNTLVVKTPDFLYDFIHIAKSQREALNKVNIGQGMNDKHLKSILEQYDVDFE